MASAISGPAIDQELSRTLRLGRGARVRRHLVRGALLALGVAALVALVLAWRGRGTAPPLAYVTTPVLRGELVVGVTATGTLEARNLVEVGPEVSGRVARVRVDVNDQVRKGDVLVELDPTTLEAQLAQARAQLAQARAQLVTARATAREAALAASRARGLYASGVVAEQERDTALAADERARAAVALAQASVAAAQAAVAMAEHNLGRTTIRSPIDGIVLARQVEVGQTVVAALQSPVLFRLADDLRLMRASVDVDEADIGQVHEGQAASFTVAAYLDREFPAKVVAVHNAARLVDRVVSYQAELEVDNHELRLRPGMTVTARIVSRTLAGALLVPSQALRWRPAGEPASTGKPTPTVWVLAPTGPRAVPVQVDGEDETRAAVRADDLAPGAAVITDER